ncbi:hypothetical protein GE061_012935 [Apolygus lucorum]|uniref:Cathepsin L n=1 Tax=Apolygus lucorum TaxID=248454 RepID=A0A8S9XTZ9_APOLU|nr:hypothetical protein GE061_012935 [Apolygus lucorum]
MRPNTRRAPRLKLMSFGMAHVLSGDIRNMKTVLAFACLVALGLAMPMSDDAEWESYKAKYGKNYESNEHESLRRTIYFTAKEKVQEHNARFEQGLVSYKLGLNRFADMLNGEFRKMMNGYRRGTPRNSFSFHVESNVTLPATVDWRTKGAVTPIKNQGQCGSCWAFSTTGSLEGQHALKKGKLVSLSEQQLVDCSGAEGNDGCDGGLMDNGFAYIKANNGIDTEASYPYTGEDGTCAAKKSDIAATVTGHVDIESGSESNLQDASATVGPISVAIDASSYDFQLYESGVYDESDCSTTELDHGVLVVGYGTDSGSAYWLVKNSWGTDWGINGYIQMSRNKDNQCGIATEASYPLV